jgi:abortive infection bacteriophage resistance protein
MRFTKPPATIVQQIEILRSRGMVVEDHDYAKHYLKNINYYRLSAYWLPFEIDH